MFKSAKARGAQRFHAEVRKIMETHNCDRNTALRIRRGKLNATVSTRVGEKADEVQKMSADDIAKATGLRIEFLTGIIKGQRQQLDAYLEELGRLVGVAKALNLEVDIPTLNATLTLSIDSR